MVTEHRVAWRELWKCLRCTSRVHTHEIEKLLPSGVYISKVTCGNCGDVCKYRWAQEQPRVIILSDRLINTEYRPGKFKLVRFAGSIPLDAKVPGNKLEQQSPPDYSSAQDNPG